MEDTIFFLVIDLPIREKDTVFYSLFADVLQLPFHHLNELRYTPGYCYAYLLAPGFFYVLLEIFLFNFTIECHSGFSALKISLQFIFDIFLFSTHNNFIELPISLKSVFYLLNAPPLILSQDILSISIIFLCLIILYICLCKFYGGCKLCIIYQVNIQFCISTFQF